MHKPPHSFESRNPFSALREMNVIFYQCNGFGHRSYECRRSLSVSCNNFSSSSFNVNVKCYHHQNFSHIAKNCKLGTYKKKKSVLDQRLEEKTEQKIAVDKKKEAKQVWVEKDKSKAKSNLIM